VPSSWGWKTVSKSRSGFFFTMLNLNRGQTACAPPVLEIATFALVSQQGFGP